MPDFAGQGRCVHAGKLWAWHRIRRRLVKAVNTLREQASRHFLAGGIGKKGHRPLRRWWQVAAAIGLERAGEGIITMLAGFADRFVAGERCPGLRDDLRTFRRNRLDE